MLSAILIYLCFFSTHLSEPYATERCIGSSLSGQPMNNTEKPLPSSLRCCTLILCGQHYQRSFEIAISRNLESDITGNDLHVNLFTACATRRYIAMRLSGLNLIQKRLPSHSFALVALRSTNTRPCGQCRTLEYSIFRNLSRDIISIVSLCFF